MRRNENGSASAIVVVTILFILMILGTYLTTISSKRKSQLQETALLQKTYGGDMKNIYEEQLQKKNIVASSYTDILYVEATGTQSISGITLPNNYKISITASLEEEANYNIFDCNLDAPKLSINSNKKLEFKGKNQMSSSEDQNVIDENVVQSEAGEALAKECDITFNQKVTIMNDCSGSNSMILLNGAKVMQDEKVAGTSNINLFNGFKGKIYSIYIYEGDILRYNLTPCYKNDTKKVGLYDNVNKMFYGNTASGVDFKAGPEI